MIIYHIPLRQTCFEWVRYRHGRFVLVADDAAKVNVVAGALGFVVVIMVIVGRSRS